MFSNGILNVPKNSSMSLKPAPFFHAPYFSTAQNDNQNVYNTSSCIEKPYRCPHPKIKFFLYTRHTQEYGEELNVLDTESLWNSHWNPEHPVKIIIHGE